MKCHYLKFEKLKESHASLLEYERRRPIDSTNWQKRIYLKENISDICVKRRKILPRDGDKSKLESNLDNANYVSDEEEAKRRFEPSKTLLDYLIKYSARPNEIPEKLNYKLFKQAVIEEVEDYFASLAEDAAMLGQDKLILSNNNQFNQTIGLDLISNLYLKFDNNKIPMDKLYEEFNVFFRIPRQRYWGTLDRIDDNLALIIDKEKALEVPDLE